MSNVYIQEPPTSGKVLLKTSVGDIDIELWTKEAPKACRNFIKHCMDGYYNGTIFHRVVKNFIVQGGDPTGTGEGGQSIYNCPFKDEFHTRLRFCRRGLVAMANAGKDDNGSQFFITLASTPELQNKHTIFGKIAGNTIYNVIKFEDVEVDHDDRPIYPERILKADVLLNPFNDLLPSTAQKNEDEQEETKRQKRTGVKNFKLLSFGDEAEEDEEEFTVLNKQLHGKSRSAHDNLQDPKLSSLTDVDLMNMTSKETNEQHISGDERANEESVENDDCNKEETRKRITDKLRDSKRSKSKQKHQEVEEQHVEDFNDEESSFSQARKKKLKDIKKEIRDVQRSLQEEKAKPVDSTIVKSTDNDKLKRKNDDLLSEYTGFKRKNKAEETKIPKKGPVRDSYTAQLLSQFSQKIRMAKEDTSNVSTESKTGNLDNDDVSDVTWLKSQMKCETTNVVAKDASTKSDDWFEIYDPRNPLNKRRRGEKVTDTSEKSDNSKRHRH